MLQKIFSSSSFLSLPSASKTLTFFYESHLIKALFSSSCSATFATAAGDGNPPTKPHFMAEYLVSSCGFSPEKAMEASNLPSLRRIRSPHQPDSVLGFLRGHGFDDAQIRRLLIWFPHWLSLSVDKTLAPKFRAFQEMGFSGSDLKHLVASNPAVVNLNHHRNVYPKIKIWRELLGSNDLLMGFLKKNRWLLSYSIEKTIQPNRQLLLDCGIPDERITMVVQKHPSFISQRPDSLKALVSRVDELGVPQDSRMFLWALWVLHMVSPKSFEAKKKELVNRFGWSEEEFVAAFGRSPSFLTGSLEKLREKMEFLVEEVGCGPSYVARHPVLLTFSLEKRLIPRHRLLEALKSRKMSAREYSLRSVMGYTDKKFLDCFVLRNKEKFPELIELYAGGCKRSDAL